MADEPLADRILAHIADFEKVKPSAHKHLSLFKSYETLAILFDQIGRAHVDISKRGGGVKGMSIDERVSSLLDKVSSLSPQPPTSEPELPEAVECALCGTPIMDNADIRCADCYDDQIDSPHPPSEERK